MAGPTNPDPPQPDRSFFDKADAYPSKVLDWRPVSEWGALQSQVIRSDVALAELMLGFMRETAGARNDEARLLDVIADFAFRAFPRATHHILVARDEATAEMRPLIVRSRDGAPPKIALSRTIVARVMDERCALLFARGQAPIDASHSVVLSRLETAICAPLMGSRYPFGIIQLDIRYPGKGRFSRADVDLLSVFASQVGLSLEHLQMAKQQRRALHSTISALMHSLTLKDPDAAQHSKRVQHISLALGRRLQLTEPQTEVLSIAALLHDLGKQGVRDDLLFKSGRLTEAEIEEMAMHAGHTEGILDMIEYPEELREVPRAAAYHHEALDGSGPYGVRGEDIPIQARIISVADVFDALVSPRPYKGPMTPEAAVAILEQGVDTKWDARIVAALKEALPGLLEGLYAEGAGGPDEGVVAPAA